MGHLLLSCTLPFVVAAGSARATEVQAVELPGLELHVKGGHGTVRVSGDVQRYDRVTAGSSLSTSVHGPGELRVKLRPLQPSGGSAALPFVDVSVDGALTLSFSASAEGVGHPVAHQDLVIGSLSQRSLRLGDGQHAVTVAVQNGQGAVALEWFPGTTLAPAPLVTTSPETGDAPLRSTLDAPIPEPDVTVTLEEPDQRKSSVPYYLIGGALAAAFAAGTLWAIAANTDSHYKSAPASPTRQDMLNTANTELVAAQVCGLVAFAALGTATVWLVF